MHFFITIPELANEELWVREGVNNFQSLGITQIEEFLDLIDCIYIKYTNLPILLAKDLECFEFGAHHVEIEAMLENFRLVPRSNSYTAIVTTKHYFRLLFAYLHMPGRDVALNLLALEVPVYLLTKRPLLTVREFPYQFEV